ncbi:alpha-aminoadipic semialdehyde synthase, mitochondrial [Drosophila busckii]|uniref:alpha-aminoadipic semialdehyde synthase, mitochondrial n=1 Tax=Drosophila busckii TaxID=30019 RepID=UPI001432B238|nr:alpha-aminoadipic semialdehyde synthase, mitochondrial [Drosophila busckii]
MWRLLKLRATIAPALTRQRHQGRIMAIRREDQSVWERRAPFGPTHVQKLVKQGVKVIVQPSNRRAYPMQILSVKYILPSSTFTQSGRKESVSNMPLLVPILEQGCSAAVGHHTPFMHIGPAHNYRNSSMARQAIRDCGYEISLGMMPKSIGPLTFVFTGSGNVSQGAQEVFSELPIEYVPPEMLRKVAEHGSQNKLYGCEVSRSDHLERREGGGFDAKEYDEFPERYISTFNQKIAPYASVIVNGIYWAVGSPKLISIPDAKNLLRPANTPWLPTSKGSPALPHRMLAICDISADPGGSIEFMNECTTIDTPFCLYDADRNKDTKSFKGPGVLVCSIDNMPTQLPRESTDLFGELLSPHVHDIIKSDAKKPLQIGDFSYPIHSAIIASNGELTEGFQYIQELRDSQSNRSRHKMEGRSESHKKVLVLGAGMVSAPLVEWLHREKDVSITVCSQVKEEADRLAQQYAGVDSMYLNVNESTGHLQELCSKADVVVSLLPYGLHGMVARCCVDERTHLVTASYLNDEIAALHDAARQNGVTIMNEVGLDPGIDHLLALECIHEVQEKGAVVESFVSYCGGLPAPEHSNNSLRYKFSWSPRGVLLNTLSAAKYLSQGQIVEISGGGELMSNPRSLDFLPGFALEGFPNRDSTKYGQLYGLSRDVHTLLRGTIRYKGFSESIKPMQLLGLIDPEPHAMLHPSGPEVTWRQLITHLLGMSDASIFYENLKQKLVERIGDVEGIESLGLLDETPVVKLNTPLDTLSHYLSKRLAFEREERDLVVLRHEVGIRWPDGRREERGINFVVYGQPQGHSAMAMTVGKPAAIAAKMILDGEIQERGVLLPFTPDIYRPMLQRLRSEGLTATETSRWLN